MEKKIIVTEKLKQLGIPVSLSGFQYLRDAVIMAMDDFEIVRAMTTKLYPTIAKHFDKTASQVERSIRHAIETGWCRGDVDCQLKLFGYSVNSNKGKPTNSEFIATLADYVTMERSSAPWQSM